jgi:hypothetical protein
MDPSEATDPRVRRHPVLAIVAVVVGCVLLVSAFASLAGGAAIVWANETQRDADGFFQSNTERFEVLGHALTSERIDLGLDQEQGATLGDLATVRLRVDGGRERPVFVGIGPSDAVHDYLEGVAAARIEEISSSPFRVDYRFTRGGPPPRPPGGETFWAAAVSGPGTQDLVWDVESGDWTVVVMNADGSAGIGVDASAGVKLDWLGALGAGLLIGGIVTLVVATALVVAGVLGMARHGGPPAEQVSAAAGRSPVRLVGHLDPALGRWLWLVKWLLVIPHLVVLAFLWPAFLVTTVVAGVAVLVTGRYPKGLFDFNVGVLRWSWRVGFYSFGLNGTDRYPPFTLGAADEYPASLDIAYPTQLSRGLVLVKWWLLAIPHYLIVGVFLGGTRTGWTNGGEAVDVPVVGLSSWLLVVALIALLFVGRYPLGVFSLLMGVHRWLFRVVAYVALMTDDYPPFRLDQGPDELPAIEAADDVGATKGQVRGP